MEHRFRVALRAGHRSVAEVIDNHVARRRRRIECLVGGARPERRAAGRAREARQQTLRLPELPSKANIPHRGQDEEDAEHREARVCDARKITRKADRAVQRDGGEGGPHRTGDQRGNKPSGSRRRTHNGLPLSGRGGARATPGRKWSAPPPRSAPAAGYAAGRRAHSHQATNTTSASSQIDNSAVLMRFTNGKDGDMTGIANRTGINRTAQPSRRRPSGGRRGGRYSNGAGCGIAECR